MSKFDRKSKMAGVGATLTSPVRAVRRALTHEGGPAYSRDVFSELFLLAVTNMVGEDTFYEAAGERDERFRDLLHAAVASDAEWVARFVPWLRGTANMRSASVVAAVEYVRAGGPFGRRVVDSALLRADEPAEVLAYYQGMDVAPNGRIDLAYQPQVAINPNTYGTGNAAINSWYVSKAPAGAWTAPTKVTSASSDPAASSQNNLARQFYGDYNQLVSAAGTAWFIFTDTRNGVGCPAVDAYQHFIDGTSAVRGDMADRINRRLGKDPFVEPGEKPAPPVDCPAQFGNSDAYVSVITP